jgi:hypothetical protein
MLNEEDVMNISNCNTREAQLVLKKVRKKLGKDDSCDVRTFDFCDKLDVDEMFVQVFLASLKNDAPLPPAKRKPTPNDSFDTDIIGPPRLICEIKADLQKGILDSFETLQMRAKVWLSRNPPGEPMYKVASPRFRVIIRPFEIAHILEIHIQTARTIFNEARSALELPKQRFMDLRMFCHEYRINVEDTRRSLSNMHDDPEEDDE